MRGFRDITDEGAAKIDESMKTAYSWAQKSGPYASCTLSNNNANIKRIKDRLAQLRALDEMPEETIEFDGGRIIVDIDENRVKIEFDERQSDEMTAELKSNGFKWSRNNGCWQRLRTKNALRAARRVCGAEHLRKQTRNEEDEED
jgi:ATP-dependent DNA ligase